MARIETYPIDTVLSDGDLILGSNADDANKTVNFTVGDLGAYILSGSGGGTGTVTSVSGVGTVSGLTLTGTVTTSGDLTLGGTLALTSSDITTGLGYTPPTTNTTYDYGAVGAAGNISMAMTGSDATNDVVTIQAGSNITLTDNGSNTFTIASAGGTVTEVAAEVLPNTSALDVTVANSTTSPNISIAWQGTDNTRLVAGDGTLVLPVITAITTNGTSGVAALNNNVLNIPDYSGSSITLTTTGTTGPATLAGGVLNVPNYSSNPGGGTVTRVGALNGTFISSSSADITSVGDLTYDLSATGTPSATSFLRGDNTWATPAGSGTVTEVTGDQTAFIRVTTTNPATTPVVTASLSATGQTPDAGNFLRGDNQWADAIILTTNGSAGAAQFNSTTGTLNIPQYLSSAVQSVGVSMPSAFTVSNSPITSQGTIAISGAGTSAQYVNGLGALEALNTIPTNINLTTTGTSGAATLSNNNLNIPQYVTPAAGSVGNVQFNNGSGGFAAEGEFNYNTATNTLTVQGVTNQPSLKLASAQQQTPGLNSLLSEIESYYLTSEVGKIGFVGDGAFAIGTSSPTRLELQTTSSGSIVATTKATIKATGELILNQYGSGTFNSTAVKSLGVTASGNVVERDVSGGNINEPLTQSLNLNSGTSFISVASSNADLVITNTSNLAKTCEIRGGTGTLGTTANGVMTVVVDSTNTGGVSSTTQIQYRNQNGIATNIGTASANDKAWVLTFAYYGSTNLILINSTEVAP